VQTTIRTWLSKITNPKMFYRYAEYDDFGLNTEEKDRDRDEMLQRIEQERIEQEGFDLEAEAKAELEWLNRGERVMSDTNFSNLYICPNIL
jgi:hypothetical protein